MDTGNFFQELDEKLKAGSLQDAEKYLVGIMDRAVHENNLPALLAAANELGGIFRVTNRLEEAKKIYGIAESAIGLLGLENSEQHGTTLLNLGSVCNEANEPSEAMRLYERAEKIFLGFGLERDYRMAALYNNMSHALDKLGNDEKALKCAEKALDVIGNLKGHDVELATSYTTLALRCSKLHQYEKALSSLKAAEQIFQNLPGKPNGHYASTLNALGEIFYRNGEYERSAEYFKKALRVIKENYGENNYYREVSGNLDKALSSIGQTSLAAETPSISVEKSRISGLELAEAFYNEYGKVMIERDFHEYKRYMAVGLVGEGSECFGFDDELSESHDYGPGFCIWLPDEIYRSTGWKIKEAYDKLPKTYGGRRRRETSEGAGRVGVFSIREFYRKYTGCDGIPTGNVEWLFEPETSLATATNGKIFEDHLGEFTRVRNGLLGFYPRDVFLKKIAARMAMMSQSGQYNYERCMERKEFAAAYLSCGEFIRTAVSMTYLLNQKYMPFYKWMFRGMDHLEKLTEIKPMLEGLACLPDTPENRAKKVSVMEAVCIKIRDELERQNVVKGKDPFLNSHCRDVISLIVDPKIKNLPVMFDGK
jgi:Predicted N-acetylglucosaminyl transferase